MAKIKITTDRTWVGGKKAEMGQTYEVTAAEAKVLIANGFGEEITKAAPKKRGRPKKNG